MLLVADALTGQDAVNLARTFNERVGLTGIVLTRIDGDGRGGAALSMRAVTGKPIKLHRHRRKARRASRTSIPQRIAGRILGMGDVVALVEKAAATIDAEKAEAHRREDAQGRSSISTTCASSCTQMQKIGGMSGLMGMLPGIAKIKNQIADAQSRRQDPQAPDGDHRLDDAEGAAQSRHAQGQPQEAHRRRLRHQARGHQQAAEDAPQMADMMKAMGGAKRGPMAGLASMHGLRRRHADRRSRWQKLAEKMPGGAAGRNARRAGPAAEHAGPGLPNFPGLPGLAGWTRSLPGLPAAFPDLGKKK